jgi:hypothetical protein
MNKDVVQTNLMAVRRSLFATNAHRNSVFVVVVVVMNAQSFVLSQQCNCIVLLGVHQIARHFNWRPIEHVECRKIGASIQKNLQKKKSTMRDT